jgi:hypothetical protein
VHQLIRKRAQRPHLIGSCRVTTNESKLYSQSSSVDSSSNQKSDFVSDWRRSTSEVSSPANPARVTSVNAVRGETPDQWQSNAFKLSDPAQSVKVSQSTGPRAAPFHRPSAPDLVLSKPAPPNSYTTDANRAPASAASRFPGAKDDLVNRPPPSFNRDRNRDIGAGNHYNSHYQHHPHPAQHSQHNYQRAYSGANHSAAPSSQNSTGAGPNHSSFHHQSSLPNQAAHGPSAQQAQHPSLHHQPRSFPNAGNKNGGNSHNGQQQRDSYGIGYERGEASHRHSDDSAGRSIDANGSSERPVKKWVPPSIATGEGYSSEERNNIVFRRVRG